MICLQQMGRDETDKFTRSYDLRLFPEYREMPLIAGDQIVRASGIGTFQENVVIRIACDFESSSRSHKMTAIRNQLKHLLPKTFADSELPTGKNVAVLLENRLRNVQAGWFADRDQENCALQSGWLYGCGD